MNKLKRNLFNILSLMIIGTAFSSQLLTLSCTTVKSKNNNPSKNNINIKAEEKNIINKLNENSKLTNLEKEENKNKQKELFKDLSIEIINEYLLKEMNISLYDYFVNLNKNNNLTNNNLNYIDPNLGILLVNDILCGEILVKDINNKFEDFKQNNHDEYINVLNDMNITEEQVNDSNNINEVIAINPEEEQIEKEFEDIQNGNFENKEEIKDEIFNLNNKYRDGQKVYIDFQRDRNFFNYSNLESLETRYIEEYGAYFDEPLVVAIEMDDNTKVYIDNFDIYDLEITYSEYGFAWCERKTKLLYNGDCIYSCYRDWWGNARRDIKSMSFQFKTLTNKITEEDNIVSSNQNDDCWTLKVNNETYDFIKNLEKKLIAMQTYYDKSKSLNDVSRIFASIAWSVGAAWTVSSFFTVGSTAGFASAALLQAGSLEMTYQITKSELSKTKLKLDKYWHLYNSNEYSLLYSILDLYDNDTDIKINSTIEVIIKVNKNSFEIKDYFNNVKTFKKLSLSKNANKLLNKPIIEILDFRKIKNLKDCFSDLLFKGTKKIITKLSKFFSTKLSSILVKEMSEKIICLSTAWANPIYLAIEGFDLVFSIIDICNEIFYIYEVGVKNEK